MWTVIRVLSRAERSVGLLRVSRVISFILVYVDRITGYAHLGLRGRAKAMKRAEGTTRTSTGNGGLRDRTVGVTVQWQKTQGHAGTAWRACRQCQYAW